MARSALVNAWGVLGTGAALGVALSLGVFALLGPANEAGPPAEFTVDVTAQDCIRAMPDEVQQAVAVVGVPRLTARNQCQIAEETGENEDLTIRRSPFTSGGLSSDLAIEARQAFENLCATRADPDSEMLRSPEWLGADRVSCTRTPESGRGLSNVVVLTEDGSVLEIRLFQLGFDSPEDLQDGLLAVVDAAEEFL